MNFSAYIAKRYLRSKSSQNAVNIINFVTFLVIVIGSGALFIVLSGFDGLKTFSLSFTNTFDPDLKAIPAYGKSYAISPDQELALGEIAGIASFSKELEERVYLTHRQKSHIADIKGVDANYIFTTGVDSTIYLGSWDTDAQQAVAGIEIANLLGMAVQDYRSPMLVLAPKPGKGSLGSNALGDELYNQLSVVLSGVYAIEENLDKKYVFTDLALVQALLEKDSTTISGVNLKLRPDADKDEVRDKVYEVLGDVVLVQDRQQLNSTLHRMLNAENLAAYLIFTLVIIIALFNVAGAIIMLILDKRQNSKTLFSLGSTIRELRRIYFFQGVIVTSLGGLIGVVVASLLIWSQLAFGWFKITPSLAWPVEFKLMNVFIVLATIVVLGIVASKIASSRVNRKLLTD